MKAYELTTDELDLDDGGMEIVLADSPGKARLKSDMLNHVSFIEIRVKRAPQFDGKLLTDQTYIENGWWIERFDEVISKDWAYDHNVILAFDEKGKLLNPFPDGKPSCDSCGNTADDCLWCKEHGLCYWELKVESRSMIESEGKKESI